jgi:Cu-Zn family superoxide dismutase
MKWTTLFAVSSLAAFSASVLADETVTLHKIDEKGLGEIIGTIQLADTAQGLKISPSLKGLAPGQHGFHVHENGTCDAKEKDGKMVVGLAAGGHFDPNKVGKHEGPMGHGHMGDLPALQVAPDGSATQVMTAEHLTLADLKGRSIMIHEGGDNYADQPKPLGGGGSRIACGVIK